MPTCFYNTLHHELEPFIPFHPGPDPADPLRGAAVKMYSCGPTVYDFAHIGNFRTFLFADILRRFLECRGAAVQQVMNMTDVGHMVDDTVADAQGEDKMEVAARRLKESKKAGKALVENPDNPYQVAQFFIDAFLEDARALQLAVVQDYDAAPPERRPDIMPRPTQRIDQFIAMIQQLIAKGHAYVGADGVVYYDVHSFPTYGKLSGNSLAQLSHGAGGRTNDQAAKKHPADFFLWKPDQTHLMRWPSPWGDGYPGWHIECSSMATSILGPTIDLHTGGEDNIFPHHECEIAQAEGATGQPFARFWLHARHLMVGGQKMSKSKGTFFTIRDLAAKGYDPLVIRLALINARYRETMDFSLQGLHEAGSALATLRDLGEGLLAAAPAADTSAAAPASLDPSDQKMLDEFTAALDDDLNIAAALGAVFTWATPLHKQKKIAPPQAQSALTALRRVDHVLGVVFAPLQPLDADKTAQVESLMQQRAAARLAKDWPKSDELRKQLADLGVEVRDAAAGSTCARASPRRHNSLAVTGGPVASFSGGSVWEAWPVRKTAWYFYQTESLRSRGAAFFIGSLLFPTLVELMSWVISSSPHQAGHDPFPAWAALATAIAVRVAVYPMAAVFLFVGLRDLIHGGFYRLDISREAVKWTVSEGGKLKCETVPASDIARFTIVCGSLGIGSSSWSYTLSTKDADKTIPEGCIGNLMQIVSCLLETSETCAIEVCEEGSRMLPSQSRTLRSICERHGRTLRVSAGAPSPRVRDARMTATCPTCGSAVAADGVDAKADTVFCARCRGTFRLSNLVADGYADDATDNERTPHGAWFRVEVDEWEVGATTRSAMALLLVPFACLWSGISVGAIYGSQIMQAHFNLLLSLAGLPFLLGTLVLVPLATMSLCGKAVVRVRGDEAEAFVGVGSIGKRKRFRWSRVTGMVDGRGSVLAFLLGGGHGRGILIEGEEPIQFGTRLKEPRRGFMLRTLRRMHGPRGAALASVGPWGRR